MSAISRFLAGLFVLLFCTGSAGAQDSGGKLIYCRNGTLYSAGITSAGEFKQGQPPHTIARLPAKTVLDGISVSADGSLIAVGAYSENSRNYSLWLVADKTKAQMRSLGEGSEPNFAPFGRMLAYTVTDTNSDKNACLIDLTTGKNRVLRKHAFNPSWSVDGREIILCFESNDTEPGEVVMVDAATGSHISFKEKSTFPLRALLSPDGRYIAYNPHLSRPKLAGEIEDRKTGQVFGLLYEGSPVLDWSADSRHLLWTRYIINPKNEGACLWYEIWETALSGKQSQRMIDARTELIDAGRNARYAPDGKHILYVRTAAHAQAKSIGLYVTDTHHRKRLLAKCDDVFAVWKPIRRMEIANAPRSKAIRSLH